jgi:hypothetical protein
MKNYFLKLAFTVFLLLFSKGLFDIYLLSDFFSLHNSSAEIARLLGNMGLIGFIVIAVFNYLQRAFRFKFAVTYVYILLFFTIAYSYYNYTYSANTNYQLLTISLSVPLNLLILVLLRGLIGRIGADQTKKYEKVSNIAGNSGLLIAAGLFIIAIQYFQSIVKVFPVHLLTGISLSISTIFLYIIFRNNSMANEITDNLQEIKVKHNFFRLLTKKYFATIFFATALTAILLVFSYSTFLKTNVLQYSSTGQLANIISVSILIYTALSIIYDIFFKERVSYSFGIKINLIIFPLVILIFCITLITNTYYLQITQGDDFFFFIPILTLIYLIFSHFAWSNILFPVINTLYLPLNTQNQNDFYIKSSFLGLILGVSFSSLIIKYIIPEFNFSGNSGYNISNLFFAAVLLLINRRAIYKNYKDALHNRLNIESKSKSANNSFIDQTIKKITEFSGEKIIRIMNLLYLINPVKTKRIISNLTTSEDTLIQRAGITSSVKLYLLESYKKMVEISQTKYFPSSPNRDKIEQLIKKFEDVKRKMQKKNYIHQLSISKRDIERVYGGILATYLPKKEQPEVLTRLVKDTKLPVAKNAIISSAGINDPVIIKTIIDKLKISELSNAAYSALLDINEDALSILEDAFYQTGQSEKVQIKIVRLLGDIANEKAVEYLLKKLHYTNQNIISATLEALSNCNITLSEKKSVIIKHELDEICKLLVWNTSLMIDLKRHNASELLVKAMQVEIEYNYKSLFDLLALLYSPGSIDLIRTNLASKNYEKITFALELASVIIKDEMKPMILPLLRPMSNEEKIKRVRTIFATEKMELNDILYDIIQRDFKWINPWTKACAIMELEKTQNKQDLQLLLANMVNPDPMLAELSALITFRIDKQTYFKNKSILDGSFTKGISHKAIKEIESGGNHTNKMPILKFEIIKYLQTIDEFSAVPGEILKYLTDHITPQQFAKGQKIDRIDNLDTSSYHHIIYSGTVSLYINDKFVQSFKENTFISTLDLLLDYEAEIKLVAETDVQLYKIDSSEFTDNLNFYDEIPFSIIKNTSEDKIASYKNLLKNDKYYKKVKKHSILQYF